MPRKQAFSGKQKKQQLLTKRQTKQGHPTFLEETNRTRSQKKGEDGDGGGGDSEQSSSSFFQSKLLKGRGEVGRYALMFRPESKEETERRKEDAKKTIYPVDPEYLECKVDDFFSSELDFPVRPKWDYELTPIQLENQEKRYFNTYLAKIDTTFAKTELSYFELNLETWRQFWRVLEMSDILLCIVDIRFPPLLFPPKLYEYACQELGKHIILLLNKIDLAPAHLVLAWKEYFQTKYPQLEIICFTSYPSYNLHGNENTTSMKGRKRRGRLRMAAEGAMELFKVCEKITAGQVNISQWREKILEEMKAEDKQEETEIKIETKDSIKPDTGYYEFKKFNEGILTIGCIGQPNVGKSSVINALMGKKVVSVSKTPGHTKHFQTIFLTPNVRLCDCPGLIFPSKVPKPLQVLCGSYPIAQLREPYSTVKYLAERLDLIRILAITHPEEEEEWCSYDVADGWAQKRGFHVAKASSRLDSYRGANHILRLALDGRICLCLRPPGFTAKEETWRLDARVTEIEHIQAKSSGEKVEGPIEDEFSETESESDDDGGGDKLKSEKVKNVKSGGREESNSSDEEPIFRAPPVRTKNKFQFFDNDNDSD